jgi:phage terminase large subunit GpA-like protein
MYSPRFADSHAIRRDIAQLARPPRRIRVSQAVAEVVRVASAAGSAEWDPSVAPYVVEPLDTLASRRHEAVVFVGPARSGKTQALIDGWAAYAATCDPGDLLIYLPTEINAADYSKRRLRRMHEHSLRLKALLSQRAHDNNIRTLIYRHGMILSLGWPTSSQLAQRDARYIALSDYDSLPDDIDGEGTAFDLGKKCIQAMLSAGMALVESSPKRPVRVADWTPTTAHEAPPVAGGILPLYNRGDRRRWYWQCPHCGHWFEAPALPDYNELPDIHAAARSAHVACRHCGGVHAPGDKRTLQLGGAHTRPGTWVPDGCHLDPDGHLQGEPPASPIASFWMLGCAAAFQPWGGLVRNYLLARQELERTGEEQALKSTTNIDQGLPYRPAALQTARSAAATPCRSGPSPSPAAWSRRGCASSSPRWTCRAAGTSASSCR